MTTFYTSSNCEYPVQSRTGSMVGLKYTLVNVGETSLLTRLAVVIVVGNSWKGLAWEDEDYLGDNLHPRVLSGQGDKRCY